MPQPPVPVLRRPAGDFSETRFRDKLLKFGRTAGRAVVEKAMWLYFAARRPETPRWARATVYGALAYFILPTDAVPDLIPGVGYSDDLSVLAFAVLTVAHYIDDGVKVRTAELLDRWFR